MPHTYQLHKRHLLKTAAIAMTGAGGFANAASARADEPAAFVLVHGGWHGAWCYERIVPRLAAAGHAAIARDLPGHGLAARLPHSDGSSPEAFAAERSPLADIGLDDYADSVIATIDSLRAAGHRRVVLVGHSMGGIALGAVGERVPEKVQALVYLAAHVPGPRMPAGAYFALPEAADARVNPALLGDPFAIGAFRIDPRRTEPAYRAALRAAFYNDASEADFEAAAHLLTPDMPLKPLTTPVAASASRWGAIARHYIVCAQDNAVPPALARRFIADADALAPRNPTQVHMLPTGHSPFLTAPDALADLLLRIAASTPKASAHAANIKNAAKVKP